MNKRPAIVPIVMSSQLRPVQPANGYRLVAKGPTAAEIYLYGIIGQDWFGEGVSAKQFADDLKKVKSAKTIDLRINSEGGEVFAAKAIYTLLRDHGARVIVHVDGLAASAASYIAMAGDEILIAESAFFMIHEARGGVRGTASDMRRTADMVEQVNASILETYVARTGKDAAAIKSMMADETWFTGKEAVAAGFADKVVENLKVAASIARPERFSRVPSALLPRRAAAVARLAAAAR